MYPAFYPGRCDSAQRSAVVVDAPARYRRARDASRPSRFRRDHAGDCHDGGRAEEDTREEDSRERIKSVS